MWRTADGYTVRTGDIVTLWIELLRGGSVPVRGIVTGSGGFRPVMARRGCAVADTYKCKPGVHDANA